MLQVKKEETYYSLLAIEISRNFVLNHFELVEFSLSTTMVARKSQ